ncbi:hypothetical protein ABEB36_008546 [Hypothenemus hampei]|uniref:G-protein coupled receptors family 1 profile domain-containing protein n=1 Tax=Hypothenemus hampei TaxID=57062 RepID=A0ABD1ERB1_HYPHA
MGLKTSKDRVAVPESLLIGFELNRNLYFYIILFITVIAILGNLLVIRTILTRKYKYLQKTCIISLAISDIMTVALFAMNNLSLLITKPMIWIYGEYLCHFIPVCQVWSNLTSSIALLVIALDRYHNVIHVLSAKWKPCLWKCFGGASFLWVICGGLSYPVATFYIYIPILMDDKETAMCTAASVTKSTIFLYYICMNSLFFLPIVLMFFWFYYKIALLIWKHRKPPTDEHLSQQEITDTSFATKQFESHTFNVKTGGKKRNEQMEKKIRSFKIVVALIIAFIGCRAPYWIHMLYQQVNTVDKNLLWNFRFSAISLYLLNCVLNPLLYTYLNVTISICRKISSFLTQICCCWFFGSEFEEFETGEHIVEGIVGVDNRDELKNDKSPNKKIKIHYVHVPFSKY